MKKLLVIIAATSLALACSSQKEPAQAAVSGLDSAVEAAKPDIQQFAADRLPAVNDAVDAVKAKLNSEDYAGPINLIIKRIYPILATTTSLQKCFQNFWVS